MNNHLEIPLVSVIITTYNRSTYLEETLSSIANQSYLNIEIIIIDDGSNEDIVRENKSICQLFKNCIYYYKQNTGQPDSRNYGITKANGDFIAFCDDDDYWLLNKIEKQIEVFKKNPLVGLVTGNIEFVNEDGVRTGRIIKQRGNHGMVFESFLLKNRISSITPLLRREVFNKIGWFNTNYKIHEDWEYWRRVAYYYKFYALQDVLACVRKHNTNMTENISSKPYDQYLAYRKLTVSLLEWGSSRFSAKDKKMIEKVEWIRYSQIFRNHCKGVKEKAKLFLQIATGSAKEGISVSYLFFKYGIFTRI